MTPAADACALVVFGAAGDLTRRLLMPALANLARDGLLPEALQVVGFARTRVGIDELRDRFRAGIAEANGASAAPELVDRLLDRVGYIQASFDDEAGWARLETALDEAERNGGTQGNVLFYLATDPGAFAPIAGRLAARGLLDESRGWRRLVVEKPYGKDFDSARSLTHELTRVMREEQIYRIDHYLGKETVQNILVFRFGNGIFEPVWNRRYVDHVQITVAETLGVEGRGGYYDGTGALRDMVPNHLFQVLTFTTMEPPSGLGARALHREQAKLLAAVVPLSVAGCRTESVRAQYTAGRMDGEDVPGYRDEPRVDPSSATETYAAMRLYIDNWRWAGVPFYLRTGKRLAARRTEVVIQFQQPPLALFRHAAAAAPEPNRLVLSIQPEESISLDLAAKVPGPGVTAAGVRMRFCYEEHFRRAPHTGYETLLYDVMTGDRSLFKPAEVIESSWAIVDPIQRAWADGACPLATYAAGSHGPAEADVLVARDGRRWEGLTR